MLVPFKEFLHPRGPNGRFTESHTRPLDAKGKKRAAGFASRFKPRKVTGPDDAHSFLTGLSGTKQPDPAVGAYLSNPGVVNDALRAGKPDTPDVVSLDKAMVALPEDVAAFRRVPAAAFGQFDPKSLVGMQVRDAAYFPATLAPAKGAPTDVLLHLSLPSGTKVAPVPDLHTLVVDRAVDMAVTEATTRPDGGVDLHLVAMPEGAEPSGDTALSDTAPPAEPPQVEPTPDDDYAARRAAAVDGLAALGEVPSSAYTERGITDDEQIDAFDRYVQGHDWEINTQLREGRNDPRVAGWIGQIDAAMEASRTRSDIGVWRGLRDGSLMFGNRLDADLTGMEWREDAYLSTTADGDISTGFALGTNVNRPAPNPVLMHLLVPAGTGAVEASDERYEAEILLERGLTLRIVADRGVSPDGVRMVDVVVVPRA